MNIGDWAYYKNYGQSCQVIETQTIWGETTCRVWLPDKDTIVCIPLERLKSLDTAAPTVTSESIVYVAAAARIADALTQDVLLAPIESSVIPLSHQIQALSRAIANDRIRYLLADEVGLGKTIEAGLILRELKLRGKVARTLVVAPKGLVSQWVAEMHAHFNEDFRTLIPGDFSVYRRLLGGENLWRSQPQVICPMDAVKPIEKRRGWSADQVAEYNRERFEDLISAGWDLIIVDEAHRLGGSNDQVARYKLGQGLAEAAPYLLLLSATPHQGKTEAFHRLVALVDEKAFPDMESVNRERVQPYVIRTEKRHAIDAEGNPLFEPRRTELVAVGWQSHHQNQQVLYDAVTEYVREGYNQAMKEKRTYVGFLMILMQRLMVSSTRAIRTTLERRLNALDAPPEQLSLFPGFSNDEWDDMDGQDQVDTLLSSRLMALKNERAEVKLLLAAAGRCEQVAVDAKAEALLDWIYRLEAEEGDPCLKVLVFTEFLPTQEMLHDYLAERGFSVTCLNGSMNMAARQAVQDAFSRDTRILISTDAGGEGINLQFCHVVINYDIPWNPMRLEQRIGRVDRIGQSHPVRAINFVFEDSVEHRVREVLEAKLAIIYKEFGIDKTGDVLDSAQAGKMFGDLYVEALMKPDAVEDTVESMVSKIADQVRETRESAGVLGKGGVLDPAEARRLITHPLPHWVEQMTVNYLLSHGGQAAQKKEAWTLKWPDGEKMSRVVFSGREATDKPGTRHLTLENSKVRDLATHLPRWVPGQPIPRIVLSGVDKTISGIFSLWRIDIHSENQHQYRVMPLFCHDNGQVYLPTAGHIWSQLMTTRTEINGYLSKADADYAFQIVYSAAEQHGRTLFEALRQEHRKHLDQERDKGQIAYAARQRAVERIGLPQVRGFRLQRIAQEEHDWLKKLEKQQAVVPDMVPLLMLHICGG